jgi:transposase-like protein
MSKQGIKRRVYSPEFKAETVALIEKREKPVGQIAVDLEVNENMPRKWARKAREPAGDGRRAFPGRGRPRDEEPARPRKENKAPRNANEILKKAAVIFTRGDPR